MARPSKLGLDYFPLDVDFFEDEKLLAISGEFAVKGEIITLRLLCEIYRNGYFVQYSELLKNKLARLGGLSPGLVDEVVGKLVRYGFFSEALFCEQNILTSKGIQKRYLEATKRRKSSLCEQYLLINDLNRINVYNNPNSTGVNDNISTQSKVNESKVKYNTPTSYYKSDDDDLKKKISAVDFSLVGKQPIEKLKKNLVGAQTWFDQVGMKNSILPQDVALWFEKFCTHCLAQGKEEMTEQDFKSYFANWVTKQRSLGNPLEDTFSEQKPKKINLKTAFQNSIIKKHGT